MSDFITANDSETQKVGFEFARRLSPGDTVFLYGDLGFGKTTFVKGVAKGLGITSRVISPTFTIIRSHGDVYHIDLYRVEDKKQISEIGLEDIIQNKSLIKFIEWPEKIEETAHARWKVYFQMKEDGRVIKIVEEA